MMASLKGFGKLLVGSVVFVRTRLETGIELAGSEGHEVMSR